MQDIWTQRGGTKVRCRQLHKDDQIMFGSEIKNKQMNLMYEMVCGDCQILYGTENKENKTGGESSMHRRERNCICSFGWET
jgi:CO dehydrogenase/acetyl-CoA synthase gamma subunit (corrinoid Fe-S protein)